ncbi:hypothetical protein HPP92_027695 [Vanilla planifolia]|uniref:Methyltransferase type 11 domain-containing protein n=1 Tax=Vanilla planifolia TaxID=51239 RepID=A0A835PC01_VANPL|nr:hypothetical protein HPP92_027695 [Vanilla planifolia]KAG0448788.1 hypothetical protein HPP92_027662 [Vanilla planifolia]
MTPLFLACQLNTGAAHFTFFRRPLASTGCGNTAFLPRPAPVALRRISARLMSTETVDGGLNEGIAEFYDESSGVWEYIWGDHMHHGFYDEVFPASIADHRAAQIRMIEQALSFAGVLDDPLKKPKRIVDVGCGIGGSSRYLAKKFGAQVQGISLSPVQVNRAQDLAIAEGLADKVSFQVADALRQPFADGQFDLVWSMESGEHMPNKEKFVSELARVAMPGGTIVIVTWCHRDLSPTEEQLKLSEINLLNNICSAYYLPNWCSARDYVDIAKSLSLEHKGFITYDVITFKRVAPNQKE